MRGWLRPTTLEYLKMDKAKVDAKGDEVLLTQIKSREQAKCPKVRVALVTAGALSVTTALSLGIAEWSGRNLCSVTKDNEAYCLGDSAKNRGVTYGLLAGVGGAVLVTGLAFYIPGPSRWCDR